MGATDDHMASAPIHGRVGQLLAYNYVGGCPFGMDNKRFLMIILLFVNVTISKINVAAHLEI
jgi:hypothetical protein